MNFTYSSIGILHTCFKEKFGVPRQALMVEEARGILKLAPLPLFRPALNYLETFTHIWLIFDFHKKGKRAWRPTIDPPRLEAGEAMGVFATRSPHRPNPLGLSVVKLDRIDYDAPEGIEIHLSGVDILDGTPVLDIKPYLPYADKVETANSGWANAEIDRYPVTFSPQSRDALDAFSVGPYSRLKILVEQMLEWDPRPTSQRRAKPLRVPGSEGAKFAFRVLEFDVHWEIRAGLPYVVQVQRLDLSCIHPFH